MSISVSWCHLARRCGISPSSLVIPCVRPPRPMVTAPHSVVRVTSQSCINHVMPPRLSRLPVLVPTSWSFTHARCDQQMRRAFSSVSPAPATANKTTEASEAAAVGITDSCAKRIHALRKKRGKHVLLRVSVEAGGCSGFQYTYELVEKADESDTIFERDGAEIVVDDTSLEFLQGATVDYVQELIRNHFAVIDNPNTEAGCGCGVSFAPKF